MFRAGLLLASVVAALFFVIHPAPAHAEKRIALAVGNAAYQHTAPLRNPINDVRLIAKALGDIGFEVALKTARRATKRPMRASSIFSGTCRKV